MEFWKRLFRSRSGAVAEGGVPGRSPAPAPQIPSESDNVGTRYETQGRVESFWTPYILNRPKFPFIFYDMPGKKEAMDAMLSLAPIKLAADSGKLISTEVLQFGVYPQVVNDRIASWGFFLAGDQITLDVYHAAIASCEKYNGRNPRVSGPPKASVPIAAPRQASNPVTFDREERVDMLEQMKARGITIAGGGNLPPQIATKRHYKGPTKEAALAFLRTNPVDKPFYYLIVHTPQGVFGRDKDGIYEQPD